MTFRQDGARAQNLVEGGRSLLATLQENELFIPSDLAYGDPGRGATIPPGATLVFVIELVSIK